MFILKQFRAGFKQHQTKSENNQTIQTIFVKHLKLIK